MQLTTHLFLKIKTIQSLLFNVSNTQPWSSKLFVFTTQSCAVFNHLPILSSWCGYGVQDSVRIPLLPKLEQFRVFCPPEIMLPIRLVRVTLGN